MSIFATKTRITSFLRDGCAAVKGAIFVWMSLLKQWLKMPYSKHHMTLFRVNTHNLTTGVPFRADHFSNPAHVCNLPAMRVVNGPWGYDRLKSKILSGWANATTLAGAVFRSAKSLFTRALRSWERLPPFLRIVIKAFSITEVALWFHGCPFSVPGILAGTLFSTWVLCVDEA